MLKAPSALGLLFLLGVCASLAAQEPEVVLRRQLYGRGVHAYFAGDYDQAVALLNKAVEMGSTDPRVFYFRGLAILGTSDEERNEKSKADIQRGAKLETQDADGFYNIGVSLERVQGEPRLVIEKERRDAQRRAELVLLEERGARYNRIKRAEPDVTLPAPTPDPAKPFNPFEEKTPEPDAPQPDAPEPGTPEPGTPEPGAPEPDAPEPDAPELDAPEPDSPEPSPPREDP